MLLVNGSGGRCWFYFIREIICVRENVTCCFRGCSTLTCYKVGFVHVLFGRRFPFSRATGRTGGHLLNEFDFNLNDEIEFF